MKPAMGEVPHGFDLWTSELMIELCRGLGSDLLRVRKRFA